MKPWAACFLVACVPVALADPLVLTPRAIGKLTFGSTVSEAEKLLASKAKEVEGDWDESCHYVSFDTLPESFFMVQNGLVTRMDAGPNVTNSLEIAIGTRMDAVLKAHPEAQVTEHTYDPKGFYLTFPTIDGNAAIVMEVSEGKVASIHAGLRPSVEYVEGCL